MDGKINEKRSIKKTLTAPKGNRNPKDKPKRKLKELSRKSLRGSLTLKKRKNANILTFYKVVKKFHEVIDSFPDTRTGTNTSVEIRDAALGAFSLFFMQNPSFLDYQKSMQKTKGKNNAQSLFGVYKILSDNYIRKVLDEVHPSYVFPLFSFIFEGLRNSGDIDEFRSYNHNLLIALDGTQYHSSQAIQCDRCSQTNHKDKDKDKDGNDVGITYSHKVVTPVIVNPGENKVISLIPEFITPQDGHDKQDCENAAAKRWIQTHGAKFKELGTTLTGDDLYCNQPLCQLMLDEGLDFIVVCKKDSHKTLYEYLEFLKEDIRTVEKRQLNPGGKSYRIDTYRFLNGLPLRDGEDALEVNRCELTTTIEIAGAAGAAVAAGAAGAAVAAGAAGEDSKDKTATEGKEKEKEKVIYKNAFVTNFEITKKNVKQIVADGRARWKVENENNNVLKTKGYHLEHNFGHGKKNLSALFLTYNILAFLVHTVLDIMDEKYQLIRRELPSRMTFFSDLRALTRYIYFETWDELMNFMLRGLERKLKVADVSGEPGL
jgi:hypothetical protein